MTDAESSPKERRVKVYQLNEGGQWDDKGTGHVILNPVAEENTFFMVVRCEDTDQMLLEHKVMRDIDYGRQGDTIITWCQENNPDLALSFQEAGGCTDVWNRIVAIIGTQDQESSAAMQQMDIQLPEPNLDNVPEILKSVTETPANHREYLATSLLQGNYLKKLLTVFQRVDREGKSQVAQMFFELFKHIVLLNEIQIYEVLFSDEIFNSMVAVFDYDPTLKGERKMEHRRFLASAKFKQVMDIKDPTLVKKIHENYRMTYFKDVVLLRFLDDGALNTLGSLIYYNNATIVSHITEYPELVKGLFSKINSAVSKIRDYEEKQKGHGEGKGSPKDVESKDPFLFLQELCNIVKQMQVPQRDSFYGALVEAEVFNSIEDALWVALPRKYPWVWQASVDVLHNMLIHDSALLRGFLVSRIPSKKSLLTRLITMIVSDDVTPGLVHQLGEILRMVLDPDAMQSSDKDGFLDHFYKADVAHIDFALTKEAKINLDDVHPKYNALELFSMCAKQHSYRAKRYILDHGILQKAVKLVGSEKRMVLSVIRLIRTCIGSKDEAYAKLISRDRLFDPIIELFVKNGARYNLLNSNVIEMCEWIYRENMKCLISYLMQEHGPKFEKITYVDTFRKMATQYKNNSAQESTLENKEEKMQSSEQIDEANCEYNYFERNDDDDEEKPPMMDLDEDDGFMPRKTMEEDDKEDDLVAQISRRQKTGKLRSKMNSLPKKITVSRKNNLDLSTAPMDQSDQSPRKKRRVEEMKS
eukprot:CAMPEP_0114512192 /NCGR_PEP_ID=MMETSP0109-20121206/14832_1 /TAXON_ID=29199 /ORGANISM="Chlorarachnion reptans, Strain CCCM449" /LENGTH=755 /DNA_ID=CAMNT_0001691835 /DNA_START=404 /DNA_END=2671 /DNA_ORIENTATION=+